MIHLHSECNVELPALKTFEDDMTIINSEFSTEDSEKYAQIFDPFNANNKSYIMTIIKSEEDCYQH